MAATSKTVGASMDERLEEPRAAKEKIGHRRIDRQGEVSYKKVPTNALMGAIQLGIANSIGSLASFPSRDLLLQDFEKVEIVSFPPEGSQQTPSHQYGDFRFRTYAPIAFRYFRELFSIKPADFLKSICTEPLKELSNAGASGSIFYVSSDDQFIIKTVQHKEAEFLQKLLPGYYMNLNQNPRTLLPKFFGLFCYQSLGKNIRLLVMNNLLPTAVTMHEKYDLKGSTYKRFASKSERAKPHPTLKDLDFVENHPEGILIEGDALEALVKTIQRDTLVLESFKIMDYSLLVGIHNIELGNNSTQESVTQREEEDHERPSSSRPSTDRPSEAHRRLNQKWSVWESTDVTESSGGIMARNSAGDRLILFLGVIDILQNYRLIKKFEHAWKSVIHDGDSISVHNPGFYKERFMKFIEANVFKRLPIETKKKSNGKFRSFVHSFLALKQSPSRRRAARRSLGDQDETVVSARDVVPIVQRVPLRRSYQRQDTIEKKEKKVERLFATTRPDPTEEEELETVNDSEDLPRPPVPSVVTTLVHSEPEPLPLRED